METVSSDMSRIIVISTSYPLSGDGSEAAGSFVLDFCESLSKLARVTVVAPGLKAEHENPCAGLEVVRFKVPALPLSLLKTTVPTNWLKIIQVLHEGKKAVEYAVNLGAVDHVLCLWVLPSGYWARSVCAKRGIAYSTWALGSDIWELGRMPVVKSVLRKVLCSSAQNFADGLLLRSDVEQLSGRPCKFLPSSRKLSVGQITPVAASPPYRLVFLGRWHPNKGIDILLEALEQLDEESWGHIDSVGIAGGGPMHEQVHMSVNRLVGQGRPINLQGFLNKEQAVDWLKSADLVLIPSRIESIPVIISDAMACHRPVLCTPVGDLPELVDRYRIGRVAHSANATAFRDAIYKVLRESLSQFLPGVKKAGEAFNTDLAASDVAQELIR